MRVSETYQSIQGEGPRVGMPTTFLRFGGCNLRCPLWPCDTQHAIDPKYRSEWEKIGVSQLLERVPMWPKNVCLTGGEPMLQQTEELELLVGRLFGRGQNVEMFSNGTLEYTDEVLEHCYVVMDWKLPGSGEDPENEMRLKNFGKLSALDAVKFTIASVSDFNYAADLYGKYIHTDNDIHPQVFAGVVWGKMENDELVQLILQENLPWRLNVQVHNHIWNRSQRGI